MRHILIIFLLLSASLIGGCSIVQRGKIIAPESFGFTLIAPNIYIETGAGEAARNNLLETVANAEESIRVAYGGVNSRPIFHACLTEECYQKFGERDSVAAWFYYGDRILISPRGLNQYILTHEWSHAELRNRVNFFAWKRVPRWFDEGIAVAISEAPEHSESHWQFLVANNIPRPDREELYTFISFEQWFDAVRRYGDGKGDPKVNPVYTAAGHELRPWLAAAGTPGLLAFIKRLNDGETFKVAYQTANTAVERDAPQAALAPRPSP